MIIASNAKVLAVLPKGVPLSESESAAAAADRRGVKGRRNVGGGGESRFRTATSRSSDPQPSNSPRSSDRGSVTVVESRKAVRMTGLRDGVVMTTACIARCMTANGLHDVSKKPDVRRIYCAI